MKENLDPRALEELIVGYSNHSKGYKVWEKTEESVLSDEISHLTKSLASMMLTKSTSRGRIRITLVIAPVITTC